MVRNGTRVLGMQNWGSSQQASQVCPWLRCNQIHPTVMLLYMILAWNGQIFLSLRMVNSRGNFGSMTEPPGNKYTECRLTTLAEEMLADLEKETVALFPTTMILLRTTQSCFKLPFLLVNGQRNCCWNETTWSS